MSDMASSRQDGRHRRIRHPRRTLAALGLALAASSVAVGSGADFSAGTANPSNVFSAGTLTMSNSAAGAAIFSPSNMKPGAPDQTGTVDIQNTGSLAGSFSLSRDSVSVTDAGTPEDAAGMDHKIVLTVVDCGKFTNGQPPSCSASATTTVVDHVPLSDVTQAVELGTFSPQEEHRYQFAAHLDGSADNTYQGDSVSTRFLWNAVQTP